MADINYGVNYADSNAEKAAFAALPKVLKRGLEIGSHIDHKGRSKSTITFAAPVILNGIRGNMAVVVNLRGNHYYTHRILMPDGRSFTFSATNKTNAAQEPHRGVAQKSSLADATSAASSFTIRAESGNSNSNLTDDETFFSERDLEPEGRELLLLAAAETGSSAELKDYAKKFKALESLRRRLDKLGAKSEDELSEKNKAAIEKTQDKIELAEKQLREMEGTASMQGEAAKAREAWSRTNAAETARTMRELTEENRSLKEYIDYLNSTRPGTVPRHLNAHPASLLLLRTERPFSRGPVLSE